MAKQQSASPQKPAAKKYSGIKVTVRGEIGLIGDRRTDVKKYEEDFFLPETVKEEALHVVRRFLIESRLKEKIETYKFVRTCGIFRITIATETNFGAILEKSLDDMTGEELRLLVIFKGMPRELIEDVAVEYDLVKRIKDFLGHPEKYKSQTDKKVEQEKIPAGTVKTLGEKWSELDEK